MNFLRTFLIIGLLFITMSCTTNDTIITDNSAAIQQVQNTAKSGDWRITNFNDSGTNKTANFTGFSFTFSDNNTITAVNGSTTVSGTWSVRDSNNSSNDDSSNDIDFDISFASPRNFQDLTEDWSIVSSSNSKIDLKHVSGGNGGTDLLTFEKN